MCASRTSQDGKIGRDTWTQQEGLAHDLARTWEWAYRMALAITCWEAPRL